MILPRKGANASRHMPKSRPDDGQQTVMWHQTVMREAYAETAARGVGLVQRFVSTPTPHNSMLHTEPSWRFATLSP